MDQIRDAIKNAEGRCVASRADENPAKAEAGAKATNPPQEQPDMHAMVEKVRAHLATPEGQGLLRQAVEEVRRASAQLREAAKI